ncbi:unnamed protein product [Rhizoctonia solani]|uniref:Uncharacterized protein n=2 Tax=Rhizoctonia solani TaxID=456999 RepID=A0A8H3DLM3_9AGAM|nr:unnamed protein product [Rhizoctonia solani]
MCLEYWSRPNRSTKVSFENEYGFPGITSPTLTLVNQAQPKLAHLHVSQFRKTAYKVSTRDLVVPSPPHYPTRAKVMKFSTTAVVVLSAAAAYGQSSSGAQTTSVNSLSASASQISASASAALSSIQGGANSTRSQAEASTSSIAASLSSAVNSATAPAGSAISSILNSVSSVVASATSAAANPSNSNNAGTAVSPNLGAVMGTTAAAFLMGAAGLALLL